MRLLSVLALIFINLNLYADIAPNPIQGKNIAPNQAVTVQMVSEVVNVDLYKEHALVDCTFEMRNTGKEQDIETGFPMMNFSYWKSPAPEDSKSFSVSINGKLLRDIDIYVPETLHKAGTISDMENYQLLRSKENRNKPWYRWKTHFKKNEALTIRVSYRLPAGTDHLCRFFNYLLSTGAGWSGPIRHALVSVSLKDMPQDRVISISPANYTKKGNVITWNFYDIEPDIQNDILIKYEEEKGAYAEKLKKQPELFIDEKKIGSQLSMNTINPEDVATIEVLNPDSAAVNGKIKIVTTAYALSCFAAKIEQLNPELAEQLKNEKVGTILQKYLLVINNTQIERNGFFGQLLQLSKLETIDACTLDDGEGGKKLIHVTYRQ